MSRYRLAIFDFDGTLADSFPWFLSSLDHIADRFNISRVKPEDIPALRDMSSRDALTYLGVPFWQLPSIAIYVRGLFTDAMHTIPLFAGATEMLAALHSTGVKLALVSSNGEGNVRQVLGSAAAGLIDIYACGASLWGKADKFHRVLRSAEASEAETISVGDEVRDVEAARSAGLTCGSITFGYNSRRALQGAKPDHLFDTYDQLLDVVGRQQGLNALG
ncbi:MAG: HAD hydrolase-like protein [Devosia sp.]